MLKTALIAVLATPLFVYPLQQADEEKCGPYKNCTELRKDHPEGVPKDHCAYKASMDRDKDGWACES